MEERNEEIKAPVYPLILVIDDDIGVTDLLKAILATEVHQIIIAHEGRAGLSKAVKYKPSLILLNVNLPCMNGIEICRTIRNDDNLKSTPIIMITGETDPALKEECMKAGADDFVTKPFEISDMVAKVNCILRTSTVEQPRVSLNNQAEE